MAMILDVTAGNRHIWRGWMPETVDRDDVIVFCDVETRLRIPPDIICDNTKLPFRHEIADSVIYDPPHWDRGGSWIMDPQEKRGAWWGSFKNKADVVRSVSNAARESRRVLKTDGKLYFKWADCTSRHRPWKSIDRITILIKWAFNEIDRIVQSSKAGSHTNKTYWITFRKRSTETVSSSQDT